MSKPGKRKITVEIPKSKDLTIRPSVFERLGTKKSSSSKKIDSCRQWAQHGSCAYGKCCKFASTHVLISPSKQRAAIKDPDQKKIKEDIKRLHSSVVIRGSGPSPDGELENWDQNDLEYADTDVLEKRRQQLQRELELQLKMESGKEMVKDKKKTVVSSSTSRSSSSSSVTSSSSDGSSSSSSSARESRKKIKKTKSKRDTSSSSEGDVPRKKFKSEPKKSDLKKAVMKKDPKKTETKKKVVTKTIGKKSISPVKKSGGTPPITSKALLKKAIRSPPRKDIKSSSPHTTKERGKEKEREKEKERNTRGRSRTPKKAKSRSPRRLGSHSKDSKAKVSTDRGRASSPKKQTRKDDSTDRYRKRSVSRERGRDKDRSLDKRKDKNDDRYNKDRQRDRKDLKRDDKRRGRDRGLGRPGDKGLEKPNKPMERLLPRPEERLAALAAITNKTNESDKGSKDRGDLSGRSRKSERERDRSGKRAGSIDRDQGEYMTGRNYTRSRSMERYDRGDSRYNGPRDGDRSPDYISSRDRHYDQNYDAGGSRYPEEDDRLYGDRLDEHHRGGESGYEDRRHRGRSWEGRGGSLERNRYHGPKDWANEEFRPSGEWNRDRHWPIRDNQMSEWGDKEKDMDWHHHGHPPGSHPPHMHDDYRNRSEQAKRRPRESEPSTETTAEPTKHDPDVEDKPIPDDLSEISDDPDDILNRDDMQDQSAEEDTEPVPASDSSHNKSSAPDSQSMQDNGLTVEKDQDVKDDDENTNLDFEEISDGELEEDRNRAGLGDALGVDWASLVADVHRKEQSNTPTGGARDRWRPERVLSRIGLSVEMAGTQVVNEILTKSAQEDVTTQSNGDGENGDLRSKVEALHPVAEIQVACEKRKRQRALLFGSGGEITRALSARRDLALRRHLCALPSSERAPHTRCTPRPDLFSEAKALFLQAHS